MTRKLIKAIILGVPTVAVLVVALVLTGGLFVSACLAGCMFTYVWFIEALIVGLLINKQFSAKAWQLRIYQAIVVASWTIAVLSPDAWLISCSLALFVANILMYIGVKYDDDDDNGVPDVIDKLMNFGSKLKDKVAEKVADKVEEKRAEIEEKKVEAVELEKLAEVEPVKVEIKKAIEVENLKYKPLDDILGNCDDFGRPMCYYNGVAHSLNEAINDGQEEEAQKALDYIEGLTKKGENEK